MKTRPLTAEEEADFVRFWGSYPKRVSEKAARECWLLLAPNETFAALIIAGAERYARHVIGWDPRYVKAPQNWLGGANWNDEILEVEAPADPVLSIYEACKHVPQCTSWGQHDLMNRLGHA